MEYADDGETTMYQILEALRSDQKPIIKRFSI